jgi:hypothetical protein
MIFDKMHLLFQIRIRIHNLKLQIRILLKVSDPDPQHCRTLIPNADSDPDTDDHWMRITLRSNVDPDRDVLKGLCQEIVDPWIFSGLWIQIRGRE